MRSKRNNQTALLDQDFDQEPSAEDLSFEEMVNNVIAPIDTSDNIFLQEEDAVATTTNTVTLKDSVTSDDPVQRYLRDIGRVKLLSQKEEIEQARKSKSGNASERQAARRNLPLPTFALS